MLSACVILLSLRQMFGTIWETESFHPRGPRTRTHTHLSEQQHTQTAPPNSYAELNVYSRHYPCLVCKIYKSSQFAVVVKSHFLHWWGFVCKASHWNWFPPTVSVSVVHDVDCSAASASVRKHSFKGAQCCT